MTNHHSFRPTASFLVAGLSCLLWPQVLVGDEGKQQQAEVTFTPSDLFRGELARLEPHLELTGSGCVKVDFAGKKKLMVELVIWEKGKPRPLGPAWTESASPGEITFTVRKVKEDGKGKYRVIVAPGFGSYTTDVDVPALKDPRPASTTRGLSKVVQDREGVPVAVWLLSSGEGVWWFKGGETLEERAKRVEWSLMLQVTVGTKQ
jgi:hypothetical protein